MTSRASLESHAASTAITSTSAARNELSMWCSPATAPTGTTLMSLQMPTPMRPTPGTSTTGIELAPEPRSAHSASVSVRAVLRATVTRAPSGPTTIAALCSRLSSAASRSAKPTSTCAPRASPPPTPIGTSARRPPPPPARARRRGPRRSPRRRARGGRGGRGGPAARRRAAPTPSRSTRSRCRAPPASAARRSTSFARELARRERNRRGRGESRGTRRSVAQHRARRVDRERERVLVPVGEERLGEQRLV